MKKRYFQIGLIIVLFLIIVTISIAPQSVKKIIFWNRAAINELNIKIKLQGEYDRVTNPIFKTKLTVYNQSALVKEYTNLDLTKESQNIFKFNVDTSSLQSNQMYAFFIKPDK